MPSRSNAGYIEEETKLETSVLTLSLFSNSPSIRAKPIIPGYIEEKIKLETLVLALSLFSNSLSISAKPIERWLH